MRAVNAAGLALIKRFEGLRLESYECQASQERPPAKKFWTIGYGHTGPEVRPGMVITMDTADRLFLADVQRHSRGLEPYLHGEVSANQWAALVSMAFNFGWERIGTSTLMRLVNDGDIVRYDDEGHISGGAAAEFPKWINVNGKPSRGLILRRQAELELFIKDRPPRVA